MVLVCLLLKQVIRERGGPAFTTPPPEDDQELVPASKQPAGGQETKLEDNQGMEVGQEETKPSPGQPDEAPQQ